MNLLKLKKYYKTFCHYTTHVFFVFVLLNLGLFVFYKFQDRKKASDSNSSPWLEKRKGQPSLTSKRNGYQMAWVDIRAYEGVKEEVREQILDDFFDFQKIGAVYKPYVQFSDPIFKSKTLNIEQDVFGLEYRVTARKPEKHDKNLFFLLGGSTSLGWNVDDTSTLSYFLQKELPENTLINWAHTNYSWFQEMVALEYMLLRGYRPQYVVFVDGVNIHNVKGAKAIPQWSDKLMRIWEEVSLEPNLTLFPSRIPLFRFYNDWVLNKKYTEFETYLSKRYTETEGDLDPAAILKSYSHVIKQVRALERVYDFRSLFVWQPNRAYECENSKYGRPLEDNYVKNISKIYQTMKHLRAENFLYLGELCKDFNSREYIFVDDVHYSPKLNKKLAEKISKAFKG